MSLATLTKSGRAAIAMAMASQPLHLAWGSGNEAWDEEGFTAPSLVNWTSLQAELGRRSPASVGFVLPDEDGGIIIPVGRGLDDIVQEARYRQVPEPTPYLYVRVNFDYADAPSAVIRELGLFMGSTMKADLPAGQRYFRPGDIEEPGLLLAVQILSPGISRASNVRQTIEYVLPV